MVIQILLVWAIRDIIFFKVDLLDSLVYSFARNSSINILIIQMTAIMVCYTCRLFYIYSIGTKALLPVF